MSLPVRIESLFDSLKIVMDDGSKHTAYPSGGGFWYVSNASTSPTSRFIWPFDLSTVNSEFGPRPPYPYHNGIDFEQPEGSPVIAMGYGVVSKVELNTGDLGYYIRIDHGTVLGQNLLTGYAHFGAAPLYGVGQSVNQGDVLGYVGLTGFTSGYHLHLETWEASARIDPRNWMSTYAAA